jgi:hypothetical protein
MASQYTEADRAGLLKLAVLLDHFWNSEGPDQQARLLGEIRLQRAEFGLSPASRARLGWRIEPPQPKRKPQRPAANAPDPRKLHESAGNVFAFPDPREAVS